MIESNVKYFVIYNPDGSIELTGEHINSLPTKMIDDLYDSGQTIKNLSHQELKELHLEIKDIEHFYNYD